MCAHGGKTEPPANAYIHALEKYGSQLAGHQMDAHTPPPYSFWKEPRLHGDWRQKEALAQLVFSKQEREREGKRSEWVFRCTDRTEGWEGVGARVSSSGQVGERLGGEREGEWKRRRRHTHTPWEQELTVKVGESGQRSKGGTVAVKRLLICWKSQITSKLQSLSGSEPEQAN